MDDVKYLLLNDEIDEDLDNIVYVNGEDDNIDDIENYIELTRFLHEIYQWFDIFNYNLEGLKYETDRNNKTGINANFIGLVSSGENLITLNTNCARKFCDEKTYKSFDKKYIKGEYDNNFSYRFLKRLRNFSQHNHIPISCYEDDLCFDLRQIYSTPHYNFNSTLQGEIAELMDKIERECKDTFTLNVRYTVTAYVCSVYKIYKEFLNIIRVELLNIKEKAYSIFDNNPELIEQNENKKYSGYFFYLSATNDKQLHTFNTKEDAEKKLVGKKNDLIDLERKERMELKRLEKNKIKL